MEVTVTVPPSAGRTSWSRASCGQPMEPRVCSATAAPGHFPQLRSQSSLTQPSLGATSTIKAGSWGAPKAGTAPCSCFFSAPRGWALCCQPGWRRVAAIPSSPAAQPHPVPGREVPVTWMRCQYHRLAGETLFGLTTELLELWTQPILFRAPHQHRALMCKPRLAPQDHPHHGAGLAPTPGWLGRRTGCRGLALSQFPHGAGGGSRSRPGPSSPWCPRDAQAAGPSSPALCS